MKIEDYNKYYIQGSDHYLIPKDVFKELFNEMLSWKEESQRQKDVIDKAIELHNNFAKENAGLIFENDVFIKFMNNLLDILKEVSE